MKKKLLLGLVFLLLMGQVLAQPGNGKNEQSMEQIRTVAQLNMSSVSSSEAQKNMVEANIKKAAGDSVPGLETAMIMVQNQEALTRVTENLNRFQERNQYRYELVRATEVDEMTFIRARRSVDLLLFKLPVYDEYLVDEEGNVAEQKNFLSMIFRPKMIEQTGDFE